MDEFAGIHHLLKKAYQGDKACEEELMQKIRARILSLLRYRLMKGRGAYKATPEDVEDIVQEIMIDIYDQLQDKRLPLDYLPQWIFTIVNRRIMDYFRHKYKTPASLDKVPFPLMDSERLQHVIEEKELQNMVYRALDRLSNKCKEIISALLNDEKKEYIRKQAQQQQQKKNTIYSDFFRCRQHFIDMLKREGYES